jgi:hypothetical protein
MTMERQHFTRRIVLSAVVMGLAVLGTGVFQEGALARSKADFQRDCEQNGGVFVDSPDDSLTICLLADGGKVVCDANGNYCYIYPPPPKKQEAGWAAPLDATSGATLTDDTQPIAPVETPLQTIAGAPLEAVAETPLEAPVILAEEPVAAAEPVAAEEPMAVEASAEQP